MSNLLKIGVGAFIGAALAVAGWNYDKINEHEGRISAHTAVQKTIVHQLDRIDNRLSRIENRLDRIVDRVE